MPAFRSCRLEITPGSENRDSNSLLGPSHANTRSGGPASFPPDTSIFPGGRLTGSGAAIMDREAIAVSTSPGSTYFLTACGAAWSQLRVFLLPQQLAN